MFSTIELALTKFNDETIIISLSILLFITCLLAMYWIYNRKKFQELSHQIPASVVKNYLDSIIQNSTALKSSLFRGGGLDLEGIPSVVSTDSLPRGNSVTVHGASEEELNQKNAEIASLKTTLQEKGSLIIELESKLAAPHVDDSEEELVILKDELEKLRVQLSKAEKDLKTSSSTDNGNNSELESKLEDVTKQRDELKERLMEYEIIEEDLANLKKLQQENDELKKQIEDIKNGETDNTSSEKSGQEAPAEDLTEVVAEAPAEVAADNTTETSTPENSDIVDAPVPEAEDDLEAAMAAAIEETPAPEETVSKAPSEAPAEESTEESIPSNGGEQKSTDELLSEFEKMLG